MGRFDIAELSSKYTVRRLKEEDIPSVYALGLTQPQYFNALMGEYTFDSVRRDMTDCPPGKSAEDKYYVGFFDRAELTAVLDLIDGYPVETTAYIGFFMLSGSKSGCGRGSKIVSELCRYLKSKNISAVRLCYEKANPQSSHFWRKNGFKAIYETEHTFGLMVVAERNL